MKATTMTMPPREELLTVLRAAAVLGLACPGCPHRIACVQVGRYCAVPKRPGHRIDWADELRQGPGEGGRVGPGGLREGGSA